MGSAARTRIPVHRWPMLLVAALFGIGCGGSLQHEASLTVANRSDFTICHVYLAPHRTDSWGDDRLEPEERIGPEQAHTFDVAAGRWNVRMDDCGGRRLYARQDIPIRGARRIDFRPAEVDRQQYFGLRRYARERPEPTF